MKKVVLAGAFLFSIIVIQAFAQCNKTHYRCTDQFSKEQRGAYWNLNNQSRSAAFEKGKVYEMSFIAYEGFEYRLSTCSDVESANSVKFELSKDIVVRVKDKDGNTNIKRQREVIFDNEDDGMTPYVLFTTDKTTKFYVAVNVPATGSSENKKLTNTDNVCVGVLLEHRKTEKLGF
ncbi:hypothetical protein [Crocinitomix algicola]|uniref:hypothetical protein n=1 Tax=Crocinitomix algicola TaxID=1740263 RepID=UPI000872D038|nr:hypothetical protein [Crocinitomix algicola]